MNARRILLIDDDPNVTKLLQLTLERHGAEVAALTEARGAVARAKEFRPRLVVCDIDLGSTDGGVVAHQFGADPATASIPIIYLSSLVTPADSEKMSGGRKLISKQLPYAEIVERILAEIPA